MTSWQAEGELRLRIERHGPNQYIVEVRHSPTDALVAASETVGTETAALQWIAAWLNAETARLRLLEVIRGTHLSAPRGETRETGG